MLWGVGALAAFAVAFNFGLSHTGADVLLRLPGWLPGFGGVLTLEGLVYGLDLALGLAACCLAGVGMSLVIEPFQLVAALPAALARSAVALGAAMTLVPRLGQSVVAVREAQRFRGWRPRGLRSWSAVAVPAVLTAVEGSVLLAEAMEARAFGSGPRSSLIGQGWSAWDRVVAGSALLAIGGFVAALVLGQVPTWQPYPDLSAPAMAPGPSLLCLLLYLPAARR